MMGVTNPINSTNSLNFINAFNAKNAFTPKAEPQEVKENEENFDFGVKSVSNSILDKIDVKEVQQYAENLGASKLTEDELKYGLMYGRSVLVNMRA